MSKSNPDKIIREKINSLNRLPVSRNFDKQGVWEKLDVRLDKGRVRIPHWLYYAAAVFAIMVFILTGKSRLSQTEKVKKDYPFAISVINKKSPIRIVISPDKNSPHSIHPEIARRDVRAKQKNFSQAPEKEASVNVVPEPVEQNAPPEDIIATNAAKTDSADGSRLIKETRLPTTVSAVANAKKKLPVVCLNEIEDYQEQALPPVTRKERPFLLTFFNAYKVRDSAYTGNTDKNIFKITLISKN